MPLASVSFCISGEDQSWEELDALEHTDREPTPTVSLRVSVWAGLVVVIATAVYLIWKIAG